MKSFSMNGVKLTVLTIFVNIISMKKMITAHCRRVFCKV